MLLVFSGYLILFRLWDIIKEEHICYLHIFTHLRKTKCIHIHKLYTHINSYIKVDEHFVSFENLKALIFLRFSLLSIMLHWFEPLPPRFVFCSQTEDAILLNFDDYVGTHQAPYLATITFPLATVTGIFVFLAF